MPPRQTGAKKAADAATNGNGNDEANAALEAAQAAAAEQIGDQYVSYRADAEAIKGDEAYKDSGGKMTGPLYDALEPLLFKPTPPVYIEHRPKGEGNPYPTTGLKSTQIQVDRMNDVLGRRHWRTLLFYSQNGTLCKAVVIVGNDLHWARLDEHGELLPYTVVDAGDTKEIREADIVALHEGWGGWKSNKLGDTFKSAETNALKRVLARFGPGADVYRVDYEEDILATLKGEYDRGGEQQFDRQAQGRAVQPAPKPQQQRAAQAPAQQQQAQPQQAQQQAAGGQQAATPEEAEAILKDILEEDVPDVQFGEGTISLKELRSQVNEAMLAMPERSRPTVQQRLALLSPRKNDPQQLNDLLVRAQNAGAAAASEG